jgi:cysteine synthase
MGHGIDRHLHHAPPIPQTHQAALSDTSFLSCRAPQFESDDNPLAHYSTTGPEIWEQTGGKVDCIVAGAGTGGTINGLSKFLKEKNPDCKVICVEPTESRVLQGEKAGMHGVVGIGAGIELALIEKLAPGEPFAPGPRGGAIDEFLSATTPECVQWSNRCAAEEGMLVGPSSGAVIKVACEVANRPEMAGKTVVAIQASSAVRYLAHPLWADEKAEAGSALPVPPNLEDEYPILRWSSEDYVHPAKE